MFWIDKIESELGQNEVINDSKTPSGRVHIGSLRGVVLHYAIYKALERNDKSPTFYYGVDDYDPVDELPFGIDDKWKDYMGRPLCHVPSPDESFNGNFAEYYMREFEGVYNSLGIYPTMYKMSELYKSGKMNESIEILLNNEAKIKEIYYKVSGSKKRFDWHPLQVICEECGKIGTTLVSNFDGREVEYTCEKSLVKWAVGCGYKGKTSPFDGCAKLPWKLEWVGKWNILNVSVEGAGKDHSSKGGSRDVSSTIYKELFNKKPPYSIPYEFFLTGKKKMSSSKGIGSSSKEISYLLPPELLVFLMIRYSPSSIIDFDPAGDTIPRLFDEYDRLGNIFFSNANENANEKEELVKAFEYAQLNDAKNGFKKSFYPRFSTIATLVQIPGVDVRSKVGAMKGEALSEEDISTVELRIKYSKRWLSKCAGEHHIFSLKERVSNELKDELNEQSRLFIKEVLKVFERKNLSAEAIHQGVYEATQKVGLKAGEGFKIIYMLFIGKKQGPRIGTLLSGLDYEFIRNRFNEALPNSF